MTDDFRPEPIEGVEGALPPEVPEHLDLLKTRRRIGYVLGALSIISLVCALRATLIGVMEMQVPAPGTETFAYVRMGLHAVVVVAWVWFSYQVLRAAERLIIPYWWLRQNIDAVKVMLGISDPWRAALSAAEKVVDIGTKAAQAAAKLVEPPARPPK